MVFDSSLRIRMIVIALAALAGMLAVGVVSAISQRNSAYEQRETLLRSVVESTRSQLMYFEKQEQEGKLSREAAQTQAREVVRNARYQGPEYLFIYKTDGHNVLLPPKPESEGKQMIELKDANGVAMVAELIKVAQKGGGFVNYRYPHPGGTQAVGKISYAEAIPQWDWVVGTGMYVDDVESAFWRSLWLGLAIIVALALAVFALVFAIGRSVLRQIGGEPSEAVAIMKQVADGDLRANAASSAPGSVLAELNALIGKLRSVMQEITADADHVARASHGINGTSRKVAEDANRQADSTQSMAAAMEQLTVSITHISDHAHQTESHARGAAEHAQAGETQVRAATTQMRELEGAVGDANTRIESLSNRANQVGAITASIKEIASQTNLLALNAAIEAARAGETGRGFAVVADEVRKLAERTATATIEIESMLSAIQAETGGAVGAMTKASTQARSSVTAVEDSARLLRLISEGATQATELVAEVANSTREQSAASTSLAQQVEQIAHMVESTSDRMHETTQATQELEQVAGRLNAVVGRFRC